MESLGINPVLIVAQIVSFSILYVVLKRFLYRPIQKVLESRREAIKSTFSDREQISHQLAEFENQTADSRKKTLEEARKILQDARNEARLIKANITEEAVNNRKREVAKASEQIQKQQEAVKKELEVYVKQTAMRMAEKIITEKSSDDSWQKVQLSTSIQKLGKKLNN